MHEQIELAMLLYTYARSSRRKEISTTVDYISSTAPVLQLHTDHVFSPHQLYAGL